MLIFNLFQKGLIVMIETKILHIMKIINVIFLAVLLTKLYALMIDLGTQFFFTEEKMQSINLLKQLLSRLLQTNNKKEFD